MKLTKERLKQIIREEANKALTEEHEDEPSQTRDEKTRFFTSSKLGQLITGGKDGLPDWNGEKYIQIYLSELEVYADDQAAADKAKNAFWEDMGIREPSLYVDDKGEL